MWNILSRDFRNVCFQLLLLILPAIRKSLTHMRFYRAYVTTDGIPFTDFSCDKCWFILGIWKYTYPCDRCHGGSHDTRGHNCSHSIVYFIVAVSITNDTKKRTIQFNPINKRSIQFNVLWLNLACDETQTKSLNHAENILYKHRFIYFLFNLTLKYLKCLSF